MLIEMQECRANKDWAHFYKNRVVQKLKLTKMLILKIVLLIQYFKPVYFLAKINLNYARQQKSCCFYDGNVVFSKRARRKGIKRFISCNVLLWPSVLGRWPDPNIAGYKSLQTGRQKRLHLRFCLFCVFFLFFQQYN